jgi:hypothetical protein
VSHCKKRLAKKKEQRGQVRVNVLQTADAVEAIVSQSRKLHKKETNNDIGVKRQKTL